MLNYMIDHAKRVLALAASMSPEPAWEAGLSAVALQACADAQAPFWPPPRERHMCNCE